MSIQCFPHDVEAVASRVFEGSESVVLSGLKKALRDRDWDYIASLRVDPRKYGMNAWAYRRDVVAAALLSKCEQLPTSFDREARAYENFWKSEKQCYRANERLSPFLYGASGVGDEPIREFLSRVRKNVSAILGPAPDLFEGRFGPGATYSDRGQFTTVPDKMSSCPTLTGSALPFLFQWTGTAWASACASESKDPVFVRGNRFTTVPKDGTKRRGICVEPSINVFYQLGVGNVVRQRLLSYGLDLTKSQEIHRLLARWSSKEGHLATIDLSNASDTISYNLVKLLLPHRWFEVLDALRSTHTLVKGQWVKLEKFSSMGNGFTFELETLLFHCITKSMLQAMGIFPRLNVNIATFGDDIIVPTESSKEVIAFLNFLGFEVNEEKTFVDGPFRESCGGDFFNGVDVRPFHIKNLPHEPQDWIVIANGLRRVAEANDRELRDEDHMLRAWMKTLDFIPSDVRRCRGPKELGDIVIHDDESRWSTRTRGSIRMLRAFTPVRFRTVPWNKFRPSVILAGATYGCGGADRGVMPRDGVISHGIRWVPFS